MRWVGDGGGCEALKNHATGASEAATIEVMTVDAQLIEQRGALQSEAQYTSPDPEPLTELSLCRTIFVDIVWNTSLRGACMKRLSLFAISWCFSAVLAAQPDAPDKLFSPGSRDPFWVSAAEATAPDGSLDFEALGTHKSPLKIRMDTEKNHSSQRQQSTGMGEPCPTRTISITHLTSHLEMSFTVLAKNAFAVYRGRVIAVTPGFDLGSPRSLLTVQITSTLRGDPKFPAAGNVFTTYPTTDFRISGHRFCNVGEDPKFAPRVDDEILLLAFAWPGDTSKQYLSTDEEHLFFERDGHLIVPMRLQSDKSLLQFRSMADMERYFVSKDHPNRPRRRGNTP